MAVSFLRRVSRYFKRLGLVGYRKPRTVFGAHPLLVSTLYIGLTLLAAALLRRAARLVAPADGVVRQMLLEFIATLELCAACFELIIVADNWGVSAYALYLFALTLWWGGAWGAACACPCGPIEEAIEGGRDFSTAGLLIAAQVLGGLATFPYVQLLWAMELAETHRGKAFERCTADLQVHFVLGALIEAVATCACRIASRALAEVDVRFATVADALFGTMMVVAAFNYSGGYFNPALATSLKLGCKGNTFVEHMVVYWLGATLGSVASIFIYRTRYVQSYVKGYVEKVE